MAIKDLQQQQAQVGRIRIGQQVPTKNGKTRPEKLDRFRFTTPSRPLAEAVASRYGGTVVPWQPEGRPAEFEVVSDASSLPVLVPPRPVTQWYEMWSGAGCQRRCDGETETLTGEPCKCPLDQLERAELAGRGSACKATTRLKVMLPELPGIGVWRLDSHGYYAAIELPQTADFLGAVTDAGGYIRATLALEQRQVKRPGVGIRTFLVPALHVEVTPEALIAGTGTALAGPATAAIAAGNGSAAPAGPLAIEQGDHAARERAQDIADAVAGAQSRDDVARLWSDAGPVLLDFEVADPIDGVVTTLGKLLQARGRALAAPAAAPRQTTDALSSDPDDLWIAIVNAAADINDPTFDVDLAFAEWSGGTVTGAASVEQLQGFLQHLRKAPA